jgi:Flp pilus assembly protein TadD
MPNVAGSRSLTIILLCALVSLALPSLAAAQSDVLWLGIQDRDDVRAPAASALDAAVRVSLTDALAPKQIAVQRVTRRTPDAQRTLQELGLEGRRSADALGDGAARAIGLALGAKATIRAWVEAVDDGIRLTTFATAADRRQAVIHQVAGPAPPDARADLPMWARDIAQRAAAKVAAAVPDLIRAAPIDAPGFAQAGRRFLEDGVPTAAVLEFSRAITEAPKEAGYYVASARAYEALGEDERARRQLQVAIELNPDLAEAHFDLGRGYLLSGDLDRATTELRRAVELGGGNEARIALAAALVQTGDLKEAGEQYRTVAENDPGNMRAAQRAAEISAVLMSSGGAAGSPEAGAGESAGQTTAREALDAAMQEGDAAAVIRDLRLASESQGGAIALGPADYVKTVRLMDREMEAILEQARRDWQAMERGAMTAAEVAAAVKELHRRSDALARAAEAIAAPEALERGYRHRVLAFNLLNQSDFGLMRYLEHQERAHYDEAIIARQAAAEELTRAWDLDAEAGWPTRTAAEQ